MEGLKRAIVRYRPESRYMLSTYAIHWIVRSIELGVGVDAPDELREWVESAQ